MGHKGGTLKPGKSAEEIAAEKAEAARVAAEKQEYTRKTTPGVKLMTERSARKTRKKPSLIGSLATGLQETLG